MKILCKVKDYYDYLAYIDGIDNLLIYDRTKYVLFDELLKSYENRVCKSVKYIFVLEIGFTKYIFDEEKKELLFSYTDTAKYGSAPISFYCIRHYGISFAYLKSNIVDIIKRNSSKCSITENPILRDTWIAKLIPAAEVYDKLYDYISKSNEPAEPRPMTDLEKVNAYGFDKKTSFRNIK